jgi:hypothetical protein
MGSITNSTVVISGVVKPKEQIEVQISVRISNVDFFKLSTVIVSF